MHQSTHLIIHLQVVSYLKDTESIDSSRGHTSESPSSLHQKKFLDW